MPPAISTTARRIRWSARRRPTPGARSICPAAGWIGFDPTNNTLADERYVKIAVGRDYDDVAPVVGSYSGTAHCRMEIQVEVERV